MSFTVVNTFPVSNTKAARILRHTNGSLFFDYRKISNGAFSRSGFCLGSEESFDLFNALKMTLPLNKTKEVVLQSTGRRVVFRRDSIGVGIFVNKKTSPFSDYHGIYSLLDEFNNLVNNLELFSTQLTEAG